jgi:hypothetical protein
MSYIKRVAVKIRSVRSPLIIGRRDGAKIGVKWTRIERILGLNFFGGKFGEGEQM